MSLVIKQTRIVEVPVTTLNVCLDQISIATLHDELGAVVGILTDRKENRIEMVNHGFDVVTVSREVAASSYGKPWPDFETLIRSHRRYEILRTLNPREFAELTAESIKSGVAFDELVDGLVRVKDGGQ